MKLLFLHSISEGSGANVHIQEFIHAATNLGAEVRCLGQAVHSPRVMGRRFSVPVPQFCKDLVYLSQNRGYRHGALRLGRAWQPDVVYFRGAPFMSYGLDAARTLGKPLFYELNAPYPDEHVRFHGSRFGRIGKVIESRNRDAAQAIFTVSRQLADMFVAQGVPRRKIVVVPNAVDLARFDPTPCRQGGRIMFGYVGSLQVWHGVEILLDAFEAVMDEVEEAELEIVGAGPLDQWLRRRLKQSRHARRLRWHGALAAADIPTFLQRMDVLLAPYPPLEDFYFSPLKLFEYMGSGRAIVASAIGQIADVVRDGENGRLLPPGDVEALVRCCVELARDPQLRLRLGAAARQTATAHTWEQNARTILGRIESWLLE